MIDLVIYFLHIFLAVLGIVGILFVIYLIVWFVIALISQIKWEKDNPGWSR